MFLFRFFDDKMLYGFFIGEGFDLPPHGFLEEREGSTDGSAEYDGLRIPDQLETIRLRGHLRIPSDQAYAKIAARLRKLQYTAVLRHDEDHDLDVLLAMPGVMPEESGSRVWVNVLLYVLTILSTLFVGVTWSDQVPPDADLIWLLTHLWLGWPFALSLMGILLAHEMGHYIAARRLGVPVSLPYFIPMPISPLGTMGALIRMKAPPRNRRHLLAVGIAGPLAGLAVALPLLIVGLLLSPVESPSALIDPSAPEQMYMLEGNSLFYAGLKFVLHGDGQLRE